MIPLNARKALRQKNAPWIWLYSLGGAIALLVALGDGGYFGGLVFAPGRSENEYHTAWICGLALGATVPLFDSALGARDLLRQRPLSVTQLFWHHVATMGRVLLVWFLAVPIAGWIWMATFEHAFAPAPLAIVEYWLAVLPAVSAAAIAFAALSLPIAWWLRIVAGAAVFLVVLDLIPFVAMAVGAQHEVRRQVFCSPGIFVLLHVAVTGIAILAARAVCRAPHDPDGPPAKGLRPLGLLATALSITVLAATGLGELGWQAAREARSSYPRVVEYDGQVKLVDPYWGWRERQVRFVDRDRRPTGEVAARDAVEDFNRTSFVVWPSLGFRFMVPVWHDRIRVRGSDYERLYLDHRGLAWFRQYRGPDAGISRVGKGADKAPFEVGSQIIDDWESSYALVHEPGSRRLYRFRSATRDFEPVTMPNGDREVLLSWSYVPDAIIGGDGQRSWRTVLRGKSGAYTVHDGRLLEVPPGAEAPRKRVLESMRELGGPLAVTLEREAADGLPAFRYEFSPATAGEYFFAGLTVWLAAMRPPIECAVQYLPAVERGGKFVVAPGGWHYPAAALVVAVACALFGARRLRRIGAPSRVRQYWLWLIVILGPVALLLSILFERPRAYRDRPRFQAVRPRVFTQPELQEKAS